jgi:hypothetical protein
MSEASATPKSFRLQKSSPAAIGILLAIAAAFLPLFSSIFFFFFSLPFMIAAFVLAIVSLVRGGIAGGIILLIAVFFAFPVSIMTMIAATKSRADHARVVHQERSAQSKKRVAAEETPEPTSSPETTESTSAATLPMIISLRQSVSIQLPSGNTVLPAGTRIQFISRNGETVQVRYLDADYEIPISATDFK